MIQLPCEIIQAFAMRRLKDMTNMGVVSLGKTGAHHQLRYRT